MHLMSWRRRLAQIARKRRHEQRRKLKCGTLVCAEATVQRFARVASCTLFCSAHKAILCAMRLLLLMSGVVKGQMLACLVLVQPLEHNCQQHSGS